MKILVTGGGGFVGRHLLRELMRGGAESLTASVVEDVPPAVREDECLGAVRWTTMDVTDGDSVARTLARYEPDVVYHLAGQASVGESFRNPLRTWEVNATGTLRLFAAIGAGAARVRRVLLVSSAEVYGSVPLSEQPIRESTRLRPATPYGASKAAAEMAAFQQGRTAGVEVVVARSFNHIGPGQDERFVIPSIARQLERIRRGESEPIVRVGNLDIVRDFVDVRDVVRAYVTLMERGEDGEAYNVCSGEGRTLHSIVERMVALSGTEARLERDPRRVRTVDIRSLVGDPGALGRTGWSPRVPLDETLGELLGEGVRVG